MAAAEEAVLSTAEAQAETQPKNEIYLARRRYNGIPASLGELRLETLNPCSSSASKVASGGGVGSVDVKNVSLGKRSVAGEFYEHGFDPEFSFRIRFQKIGAGLENLGNTCYLNSVLQCLTYTEPFAAYLQSGKHTSTCRNAGFCAMCALQNHVKDALRSTGKILRPFHLVKNLRCISSNFRISRQEDAHEYMVNLLESMHKCCLPYGVSSESPSAYEKSQVHKIFGGQLRNQVKCMQCSYCSNKYDPFLDLSLEIMKADSLKKALAHFTAVELLDGGERQYHCQRCKEKVSALIQLTIHKAPYVLTIHLKRFDSIFHGEKLSKKVMYGPTLNLNPFISDPREGDYKYTLYGVLVHAGWTTYSGHYFCYVRTSAGIWYSLDDNQVTKVSEKTVLSREAYMLFYVRDRTLGAKGAVEISPKPDISSAFGNEPTHAVERNPSSSLPCSVHARHDSTRRELDPAMGVSLQQSVKFEGPLFHDNKQIETKYSCLHFGDDIFTDKHQTEPSQEPAKPLISLDSKLPSDDDNKKCNATNENAQDGSLAQRGETGRSLPQNDFEKFLGQSDTMNDSIRKEAVGTTKVENQETRVDIKTENLLYSSHQTESKLKKSTRISSSAKGRYFGRKRLFFMSLHLPKNKQMRNKKHLQIFRKKLRNCIADGPNIDSQGASTSEMFQAIDVCTSHLPRKDLHSATFRKSKGNKGIKLDFSSVNNIEINLMETSSQSSGFCFSEGESCVKGKIAEDEDNLLITRLKQTSVAVWEDQNFLEKEREYNSKRNIDCLLDECHVDNDKSKRKKVKRSRQWFGVVKHNPFQETARFKTQQKRPKKSKNKKSKCIFT